MQCDSPAAHCMELKPRVSSPDSGVSSCPTSSYCLRLPAGWERYEDDVGDYYWHVPSGTIQRDPPAPGDRPSRPRSFYCGSGGERAEPITDEATSSQSPAEASTSTAPTRSSTSSPTSSAGCSSLSQRFPARYLGWRRVDAADVASSDRSSRAVNQCIRDLAVQHDDQAGDGFLEIDNGKSLAYQSIGDSAEARPRPQPLLSIRLWGASGQHFAYVARQGTPREFVCRVFRCRLAAELSNALCRRCQALLMMTSSSAASTAEVQKRQREQRRPLSLALFPSAQAEPRQAVACRYLGCCLVDDQLADFDSVDQLNLVIDRILSAAPDGQVGQEAVLLASPSSIGIALADGDEDAVKVEFRVRYLKFMGVSRRSVQLVGLVFVNAAGASECHLCRCEPDGEPLCRAVQAACNLRYQKCLDSRAAAAASAGEDSATAAGECVVETSRKSLAIHTVVSLFSSIWRRNSKV